MGYTVEQVSDVCSKCIPGTTSILLPTCTKEECGFVCMHMYKCDPLCYDYTNGHICKHIHRIRSLHNATIDHVDGCVNGDTTLDRPGDDEGDDESSSSDLDILSYAETCIPHSQG